MTNDRESLGRRDVLGLAALAGLAALPVPALAGGTKLSAVEQVNRDLVARFCAAWDALDIERIVGLITEDFIYQPFDKAPLTHGIAEFRAFVQPFLESSRAIRFEILRTHVIGPVVVNERIDHILAKPGGKDMAYPIAGVFQIDGGRIRIWYGFFMPGYQPEAPPAT